MVKFYESHREKLLISTDPGLLDSEVIYDFLSRAYWAQGRARSIIELSLKNSLVFGLYDEGRQIGLARVVTDHATFAWLCDVFIHEDYRGRGMGKWLMASILSHPDLQGLRRFLLATRDAHRLYSQFGFTALNNPDRWMERFIT
jgi:N-acetylglutamate synthase-like GNAT family acetyltransferase